MHRPVYYNVFLRQFQGGKEKSRLKRKKFTKNPHARFGAPKFMKAFAAHGDFFASAAVAPQGASRWHLNQIYCECVAFTAKHGGQSPHARCVKKVSQSLPPTGGKEIGIIFCRGVYLAENTSQAASVEFVRLRRTNYARSSLQNPVKKPRRGYCEITVWRRKSAKTLP